MKATHSSNRFVVGVLFLVLPPEAFPAIMDTLEATIMKEWCQMIKLKKEMNRRETISMPTYMKTKKALGGLFGLFGSFAACFSFLVGFLTASLELSPYVSFKVHIPWQNIGTKL